MTHLFENLTRAQLQDLAADLSTEVGSEVKVSVKAINAALATLPDGGAAWLEARQTIPSKAPNSPADAMQPDAATIEPDKTPAASVQRVEGFTTKELEPDEQAVLAARDEPMRPALLKTPANPSSAQRFGGLPDDTPCLQLLCGPNSGLAALEIRQGDIVVAPSEDVARLFRRGVQHARLTLSDARALVASGKGGRFNRKNSPSEAV